MIEKRNICIEILELQMAQQPKISIDGIGRVIKIEQRSVALNHV